MANTSEISPPRATSTEPGRPAPAASGGADAVRVLRHAGRCGAETRPRGGKARVVTRIRLAKSQNVLAVAEMADGSLLAAKTPIDIETDGCS